MAVGILVVAAVVFVEQAQRRIPVQYAKRQIGRQSYGGTSTYIPIKVNQAGVIRLSLPRRFFTYHRLLLISRVPMQSGPSGFNRI